MTRRTIKTPSGYAQNPSGRVGSFDKVYKGIIKDNTDYYKMGRLRVWIPDFGSDAADQRQWVYVQYCSPFAGASSIKDNTKDGTTSDTTQRSYGWWAVPPHLENEVVVMFLNGDPNQGIYIGGLYQQNMNHMVPGVPSATSIQGNDSATGAKPPVAEYNRYSNSATGKDSQARPRMDKLHNGLSAQGLYSDSQRGPSTAGARRSSVSQSYGFLSPEGHSMTFDDNPENSYIRLRTPSGAQILVNDTAGYVYFISSNGNSWYEISDLGIDGYSSGSISFRSGVDINLHADNDINMYAGSQINMLSAKAASITSSGIDLISTLGISATALTNISLISQAGALCLQSTTSTNITAGTNVSIASTAQIGINATGSLILKGATTLMNSMTPTPPLPAVPATVGMPIFKTDTTTSGGTTQTQTVVSRLPSHEPYSGHPLTTSPAASSSAASSQSSTGATTSTSNNSTSGSSSSGNGSSGSGSSGGSSGGSTIPGTSGTTVTSTGLITGLSENGLSGIITSIPDVTIKPSGSANVTTDLNLSGAVAAGSAIAGLVSKVIGSSSSGTSTSSAVTLPIVFVSPITGKIFYTYYTTTNGVQNNGVNVNVIPGSSVVAMANGTVTKYAHDTTFGNYMIISHDNGYTTKYCFLSEQIVKVGDIVSSGQSIALSGNDPVNRLNQLHFEIALNGSTVDPSTMLKNISVGSSIVAGSN